MTVEYISTRNTKTFVQRLKAPKAHSRPKHLALAFKRAGKHIQFSTARLVENIKLWDLEITKLAGYEKERKCSTLT